MGCLRPLSGAPTRTRTFQTDGTRPALTLVHMQAEIVIYGGLMLVSDAPLTAVRCIAASVDLCAESVWPPLAVPHVRGCREQPGACGPAHAQLVFAKRSGAQRRRKRTWKYEERVFVDLLLHSRATHGTGQLSSPDCSEVSRPLLRLHGHGSSLNRHKACCHSLSRQAATPDEVPVELRVAQPQRLQDASRDHCGRKARLHRCTT